MFALRRFWFGRVSFASGASALLLVAACTRAGPASGPVIRLVEHATDPAASYVEVAGIDPGVRDAVRRLEPTSDEWPRVFSVRVLNPDGSGSLTAVAGRYAATRDILRFTPLYPFDPGRQYEVRYERSGLSPGAPAGALRQTIALRPAAASAPTYVTHVFPSAEVVPENQLRMYIHFSAPMGRRGGLEHVRLFDERGEVADPFLPLDAELWNAERTRYTLLFDPGRQKRGILPSRELGPSLIAGRRYTLVVDREWSDGHGKPLGQNFTRKFHVGPPDRRPLDWRSWRVTPPAQGTRDRLSVEFPEPLDHGLLLRAIGVRRDGQAVLGEVQVDAQETRWTVTPSEPWRPGRYELIALSILEDLAGNRIGRPFEVETIHRADKETEPAVSSIPFSLASSSRASHATRNP